MTKPTILCVDDEANILSALNRLLRREGYTVLTANSGKEGLKLLDENDTVHVVVSDQRMPEMTGSEFLKQVKERKPETVRVILSGYAEVSAILEAVNNGAIYQFLTKPWDDEALKEQIKDCIHHYHIKNHTSNND